MHSLNAFGFHQGRCSSSAFSDPTSAAAAAFAVHRRAGHRRGHGGVNNAGFAGRHALLETAHHSKMVDLNCRVPTEITDGTVHYALERKSGAVIFVASTAAYQAVPYMSAYAATKAYNLILAEGLAQEYRGTGVDVLAVSPGFTETERLTRLCIAAPGAACGLPRWRCSARPAPLESAPARFMVELDSELHISAFPRWIVGRPCRKCTLSLQRSPSA